MGITGVSSEAEEFLDEGITFDLVFRSVTTIDPPGFINARHVGGTQIQPQSPGEVKFNIVIAVPQEVLVHDGIDPESRVGQVPEQFFIVIPVQVGPEG